jgi:hypothetical protein
MGKWKKGKGEKTACASIGRGLPISRRMKRIRYLPMVKYYNQYKEMGCEW